MAIAGSISASSGSVNGVVHVTGSNCFDPLTAIGMTGTLTGSNISLTSATVAGQVATLTGTVSDPTASQPGRFTGTYAINGGCSDGDQGNVTGTTEYPIGGNWAGDLTSATGVINRLTVTMAQGNATSEGTFLLGGTAGFEVGTCFKSATILSGTYPSGSYVIGDFVSLEIQTDNGLIEFVGKPSGGVIWGTYTLSGSTCEPAGTGYLSPWEY